MIINKIVDGVAVSVEMTQEEEEENRLIVEEIARLEAMREPTVEERIEAQVMYTALMTDTLLMEE